MLLRVSRDVEPLIEALDRAVVLGVRDRLRYRRRELVDLRDERRHESHQHCDKAHDEAKEDQRRGGSPAEARLESHDERVESDREERRRQRPHEHLAHLRQQTADDPQREQPDDDLHHRCAADVDGQPAPRDLRRGGSVADG